MDGNDRDTIAPNLRLLIVIEEMARIGVPVTPTAVNAALGLPKPTIHRLFATLEDEGFVQRGIDGRSFSPGPRLRKLAGGILSSRRIRFARQTVLNRLSRQIGETCNIALPGREAMTYLERVETEWPLRIQLPIGSRVPFHCTASGKMYLSTLPKAYLDRYLNGAELAAQTANTITDAQALRAELATIREAGYALDREEFMAAMIAVAVPILDAEGRLMATLSFHAPTQRFDLERAVRHVDALHEAASELSQLVTDPE